MFKDFLVMIEVFQCSFVYLYFIRVFTQAKVKVTYFVCVLASIALILLSDFLPLKYIIITMVCAFVYIVLPIFTVSGILNKTKIYISFLVVGVISFINSCVSHAVFILDMGGIVNDIAAFVIRVLSMFILLMFLGNARIRALISDLTTVSKNIKSILLIFIWELFCLNILQNTILSMNLGVKINLT